MKISHQDLDNLSLKEPNNIFNNEPAYALVGDDIYYIGPGVKPLKLNTIDDDGFVVLTKVEDLEKIFPTEFNTLQVATNENLAAIKKHTGHVRPFQIITTPPPVINLVFSGGGAQGGVYLGAYRYMYENNQLNAIKTVTGSSAGAITALLVALGCTPDQLEKILAEEFAADKITAKDGSGLRNALNKVIIQRLTEFFGDDESLEMQELQKKDITFYNRLKGIKDGTQDFAFKDLQQLTQYFPDTFKQLLVTSTDSVAKDLLVLSYESTPEVSIAQAVRASAALPLVFDPEIIIINGKEMKLIDGGVWDNLPFALVEGRKYRSDVPVGHRNDFGQNPQSLCLAIASSKDQKRILHQRDKTPDFWWLLSYFLGRLLTGMPFGRQDQDMWRRLDEGHSQQVVLIDPVGVGVTTFSLTQKQKDDMATSGYMAMQNHDELYGQADSIIYEYNSLFEMLIGLDQKNVDALIQKGKWDQENELSSLKPEYEAAMQIRKLLYGSEGSKTEIDKIKGSLDLIEKLILRGVTLKEGQLTNARKVISESLETILRPLDNIKNLDLKERFQHAVLNKVNYECSGQLARVSLVLHKTAPEKERLFDVYGLYAQKQTILSKAQRLVSQMQQKIGASEVNVPLIRDINNRLRGQNLTDEDLVEVLNDICEKYQRRTFRALTKIFPPESVKEARQLRDEVASLQTNRPN